MKIPQVHRVKLAPKELAEIINDFGCKKIMTAFSPENYLLYDYPYDNNMLNTILIENSNEDVLLANDYNCGYKGSGPNKTKQLLTMIGVDEKDAERYKSLNGFQLLFDENGKYSLDTMAAFPFRAFGEGDKIDLRVTNTVCNFKKKQIYFIDPKQRGFTSLLRTLDLIKIEDMKAYIGEDNSRFYDFSIPYVPNKSADVMQAIRSSFIIFEGKPFTLICFVGKKAPASIVNTLSLYASGRPLLQEDESGRLIVLGEKKENQIKKHINLLRKPQDIYISVKL